MLIVRASVFPVLKSFRASGEIDFSASWRGGKSGEGFHVPPALLNNLRLDWPDDCSHRQKCDWRNPLLGGEDTGEGGRLTHLKPCSFRPFIFQINQPRGCV